MKKLMLASLVFFALGALAEGADEPQFCSAKIQTCKCIPMKSNAASFCVRTFDPKTEEFHCLNHQPLFNLEDCQLALVTYSECFR